MELCEYNLRVSHLCHVCDLLLPNSNWCIIKYMQLRLWLFSFEIDMRKKSSHHHHPLYFTIKNVLPLHKLYTGSPGSCCTRIFSPKTSVRAPSSALLPWFITLWLFYVPQTEVTIERVPVWRCSRPPSPCDIESLGHTTRRHAEVLPVFARSCHWLYRCRRDVLWIKYR